MDQLWKQYRETGILPVIGKAMGRPKKPVTDEESSGAFSNDASLLRLAGTILMDINEEWITGQRYLSGSDVIGCQDTRAEFTAV